MARGTQHRKRRTPANARVTQPAPPKKAKRVKHESWEDQLFFSRLRAHAKWVFVFLALAFGLGFVLFGVGSGSSGITEAMQSLFQRSSSGTGSLSKLQKNAKEHPKDAKAWRDLATKLEADQKLDRATIALERYIKLRPKDQGAIEEVAGLYTRRASDYYVLYRQIQFQQDLVAPESTFRISPTSTFGKGLQNQNPILTIQSKRVTDRANNALTRLGTYNAQSEDAYKRLVKLAPENATYQLQLGEVAANIGDKATATKAYKAFLKLAPNDSLAPRAKARLKELAATPTPTAAATTTGG